MINGSVSPSIVDAPLSIMAEFLKGLPVPRIIWAPATLPIRAEATSGVGTLETPATPTFSTLKPSFLVDVPWATPVTTISSKLLSKVILTS